MTNTFKILPYNVIQQYFNNIILNELKGKCNCWIAGGSVLNYAIGKSITNDYDLFFPNSIAFGKAYEYFMSKGAEIVYESDKGLKLKYKDKVFDLIKIHFNSIEELLNDFDLTICKIGVSYDGVYLNDMYKKDIENKRICIVNYKNPYQLFKRIIKYMSRGFSISNKEIINYIVNVKESRITEKELELLENASEESSYDN